MACSEKPNHVAVRSPLVHYFSVDTCCFLNSQGAPFHVSQKPPKGRSIRKPGPKVGCSMAKLCKNLDGLNRLAFLWASAQTNKPLPGWRLAQDCCSSSTPGSPYKLVRFSIAPTRNDNFADWRVLDCPPSTGCRADADPHSITYYLADLTEEMLRSDTRCGSSKYWEPKM